MEPGEQIITYQTYSDFTLAHIVRARLEASGIPCFVDENMGNVYPLYNTSIGSVKLKIFARDLERVNTILAEDDTLATDDSPEEPDELYKTRECPHCGSTNVEYKGKQGTGIIGALAALFTDDNQSWHCLNCGKEFD